MEALLWLASTKSRSIGAAALLDRILGLERAHWRKLLGGLDEDNLRDLGRAIAQVTLVQGTMSQDATERLLGADGFYGDPPRVPAVVDTLVRSLSRLYGQDDGIGPLQPDLIGEHQVVSIIDAHMLQGCIGWIAEQPEALHRKHRRDLLTVLQRATRPEHGTKAIKRAEAMLDLVIRDHAPTFATELVGVMIDTPGSPAERLGLRVGGMNEDQLAAINAHLPLQSLSLMDVALAVAKRRTELGRALVAGIDAEPKQAAERREPALAYLAAAVGNLSNRFFALGQRTEALSASREAVKLYRELAAVRPDAFLTDLATSLSNFGRDLFAIGRLEDALAATRDAAQLCRRLTLVRPDTFLPDLARSLGSLGNRLHALQKREEALEASQDTVKLYRRLAEAQPDAWHLELAVALTNLGRDLSALGLRKEALAASKEAVERCSRLAAAQRDAFLPNLAMSAGNLSMHLFDLGLREEALAASREAVKLYRELVAVRRDAFLPDLATSLSNHGIRLSNLGLWEEALAVSQEALDIRRELATTQGDVFLPHLAMSLNNAGSMLSELGHWKEGLAATNEGLDIRRQLAAAQPEVFLPALASSLNNLGRDFSYLGLPDDALAASREAVELYRELAAARRDVYLPDLARSLSNLGLRLFTLERWGGRCWLLGRPWICTDTWRPRSPIPSCPTLRGACGHCRRRSAGRVGLPKRRGWQARVWRSWSPWLNGIHKRSPGSPSS